MDIQVVSTGEQIFKIDDGAARALLAAFPEAFRKVDKPLPPPLPTTWTYLCGPMRFGKYAVMRKKGMTTEWLGGEPERIKAIWPECPDRVIADFAAVRPLERIQSI